MLQKIYEKILLFMNIPISEPLNCAKATDFGNEREYGLQKGRKRGIMKVRENGNKKNVGECSRMQAKEEQLNPSVVGSADSEEKDFTAPEVSRGYEIGKRIFDVVMATLALIVLSPVFLVVAILIKLEDGGPVIYSSTRLTKGAREFKMYKFRSMCLDAEKKLDSLMALNEMKGPAFKMKGDPRITKIGKIIRRTSIDELPQLVNIIKGDMSIIGPRPPLPREVAQYTPYQMHRLDVKTGLACYHECSGRSDSRDFDEWVEMDLRYIRERSFKTDLKIIWWTVRIVLTGKGAM